MIFQKPVDAVRASAFFVSRQRHDDVAIGFEVFLFHANHRHHEECVSRFHVDRAAAVEVAVFFDEFERIDGPIFAARFHDVEVADHQNRFASAGAVEARDEVSFSRIRTTDVEVGLGIAGIAKTLGHRFGGNGGAADRIGGVDFDELLVDVAGELVRGSELSGRVGRLRAQRCRNRKAHQNRKREQIAESHWVSWVKNVEPTKVSATTLSHI